RHRLLDCKLTRGREGGSTRAWRSTMGETARLKGGLVSVVVDCAGPLPRTRRCIEAVLRSTRRPWELIAIASEEGGCAADLAGTRDAAQVHVEVVPRPDNPSEFRHAPGLAAACGDYLALIDDGTIVPEGWIEGLAALADWDAKVGMVGPMLNDAPAPQWAEG